MDKLLLSLPFIVLLTSLTVNSAPMSSSKIISSIQQQQQNYDDDDMMKSETTDEMHSLRHHKMMGYFNPYVYVVPYSPPVFYPPEFYEDFSAYYGYGDEEEIMSRTAGNRKRPGNFKNSPIYYIRLPPTPYMFVPGLGYISNPPTYAPMPPPPPPPPSSSIFYNLPLDFISNGKPTNIYQWGSPAYAPQQPQFGPTYQRPQRPYQQRPMNPYLQESKVTNLKGQYLFNGRPEEIFVLPQSAYSSIYQDPRFMSPFY